MLILALSWGGCAPMRETRSETIRHWNGNSLSSINTGVTEELRAIKALGPDDVWAAGEKGVVVHWDGSAWTKMSNGGRSIASIAPGPGQDLWFGCLAGAIMRKQLP